MVVLARACRKSSREVMLASCWGSVFHVLIALGKKEYCMVIVISSTNKTDRHDITEILLKVALNTINPNPISSIQSMRMKKIFLWHRTRVSIFFLSNECAIFSHSSIVGKFRYARQQYILHMWPSTHT